MRLNFYVMVSIEQLTVRFGAFELLRELSLSVNKGDRIGLVGNNGAGKSTLLKILAGWQLPTEGKVVRAKDLDIGYLPQEMKHQDGKSLWDEGMSAFSSIIALQEQTGKLQKMIEEREDHHSGSYLKLIEEWTHNTEKLSMIGENTMEGELEKTLLGLGFERKDLRRPTAEFSGGWRMRIELAKILLRQPGLVLLDEPTNHLDIEAIQWLEEFLHDYPGAVMLVSHDKTFLDRVTNRTLALSLGKCLDLPVSYSEFVEQKKQRRETQLASYRNQQRMIDKTEEFIDRFRYKATKAVQVQSRIKQLEKLERIEVEEEDNSTIHISFPPAPPSGKKVIELKEVSKSYGAKKVLKEVNMSVQRGEKIAFVGRNGEGKTTLMKIIHGELEYEGSMQAGHRVITGYYAQNQDELIDEDLTVFETLDREAVGEVRTRLRNIMGAFLFSGDAVEKKARVLSGGERSRLALMKLLLRPFNLLLMDEPTNHLDIRSKDILKNALSKFTGTLIVVSHDREFLDGLVDTVYEFRDHKIREHLGGIRRFLEKRKIENLRELERKTTTVTSPGKSTRENIKKRAEKKVQGRTHRKLQQDIEKCEERIAALETTLREMDKKMENPREVSKDQIGQDFFVLYEKNRKELENEMSWWTRLNEELEALISKEERK